MVDIVILLSSAGRRPYLVDWFRQALHHNGLSGRVILADSDPMAPAQAKADQVITSPRVSEPNYGEWLRLTIKDFKANLALSFNDFELSVWASLPNPPAALLHLDKWVQQTVEDKFLMAKHLQENDILVPPTYLSHQIVDPKVTFGSGRGVIVKQRFGSGSQGLRFTTTECLEQQLLSARECVYGPDGQLLDVGNADNYLVVQPRINGVEFGLDVISDLRGTHTAVLARRKLSMRAGETDKATTVASGPFERIARAISEAIPHRGLIDVDVIQDEHDNLWVIDINPRFGGGYPFSHLSGANVPAAYVAWLANRDPDLAWLKGEAGVTSAKYVGLAVVKGPA